MPSSSRIIKQHKLSVNDEQEIPLKDHVQLDSLCYGKQADSLLKIAKAEASRVMEDVDTLKEELYQHVLDEAQLEIEILKKEGYDLGFSSGKIAGITLGNEEGLRQIMDKNQQVLDDAKEVYRKALKESQSMIQSVNDQIVILSVKIAEEIINKSLEIDDRMIRGISEKVLNEVNHAKYISIRVNQGGKKQLEMHLPQLKERCPISLITLMTDNLLGDGDCIVETETQIVEATIDAQLTNLKSALCEVNR
jgi:flagellar assembly protein FliH